MCVLYDIFSPPNAVIVAGMHLHGLLKLDCQYTYVRLLYKLFVQNET